MGKFTNDVIILGWGGGAKDCEAKGGIGPSLKEKA